MSATVEEALLFLAGMCDGAYELDGEGYNAFDANFGHSLAAKVGEGVQLTAKQRSAAWRMLRKYEDQLRQGGIDYADIAEPSAQVEVVPEEKLEAARVAQRVAITVEDDRIHVRSPFKYKDVCKAIPAARWNQQKKCWTYPASPTSAWEVHQQFAHAPTTVDAGFRALRDEAQRRRELAPLKEADDLPPVPVTKLDAWRHQRQAFWFAHGLPAAMLAMDMGTGKTKVTADLVVNRGHQHTLVLCPVNVIDVWPKEMRKHAGVPIHVLPLEGGSVEGRMRQADEVYHECRCGQQHMYVINYEAAFREPFASWATGVHWDLVVCDESHKVQAYNGVISKYVAKLRKNSDHRLCLTGTPMPQSPLSVFGQFRFLDPDVFGTSYTSFSHRYGIFGGYGGHEIVGYTNQEELNEKFYSIGYRVGAEVLDLPPDHDVVRATRLGTAGQKLYNQVEREMYAELDGTGGEITAPNVLVKLLRLQQITGGHVTDDDGRAHEVDGAKAELLEEVVDEIAADEPIVVFCRFIADLDVVRRLAEKLKRRYGEVSGRARDLVDAQMPPDVDVLGVQIQAGGFGIDLTRARYAIYYSLGYSLSDYQQSRRRVIRPGQERPVTFVHLTCAGTKDEDVYEALEARESVVEHVLGLRARPGLAAELEELEAELGYDD